MRPHLRLGACLLLGASALIALAACGLGVSGLGASPVDAGDATSPETGAPDTGTVDTGARDTGSTDSSFADASDGGMPEGSCTGITCNGSCMAASDCRFCTGAPLLCAPSGQCVSGCQACTDKSGAAMPIECFACDSNHANPSGTCQYDDAGTYCLNGDYLGQYEGGAGYQCSCTDGGSCPGATQVCVPLGNRGQSFCLTCGEPTIGVIQGQPCQGGGSCQESEAVCQ